VVAMDVDAELLQLDYRVVGVASCGE